MSILNNPFPHLLPVDVPVWKRFLAKYHEQFFNIDYDVRVGNGRPIGPNEPARLRKMAIMLSQMRIDAVGYTRGGIYIIEITRRAGLKAIGQLESYPLLFKDKFNPRAKVIPYLVCEELNSDIKPILDSKGIEYMLMPEGK